MESSKNEEMLRVIAKYLAGQADADERNALDTWMSTTSENKKFAQQVMNIWDASDNSIKLSDISTGKALNNVLNKIGTEVHKHDFLYYWQKVAAVLLLPLIVASLLLYAYRVKHKASESVVVYNEVYASQGTRSALKLADGSQVWLNAGSSLSYPDRFIGKQRIVILKGEAYFEVQTNKEKPFVVKTNSVDVKATGTKFNVLAFNENDNEVTLAEGKVFVNKSSEKGKPVLISELEPNQHLKYNAVTGKTSLTSEDAYKYIAWKDGKLIFRNELFSDVIKKISQAYKVDIEIQGKQLEDYRYRATFENESLSDILRLLKLSSPIDYKEVPRKCLPDGSFSKKKIIIYSKS